jgi:hypothetical protein
MMKNTLNSIWAAIKQTFTDTINRFIAGLNKVSRGVSGITGGAINFGQIEYMADGGVLTSGTAIVGEAGPEFVQISNGQAMVQPLTGQSPEAAVVLKHLLCHRRPDRMLGQTGHKAVMRCLDVVVSMIDCNNHDDSSFSNSIGITQIRIRICKPNAHFFLYI